MTMTCAIAKNGPLVARDSGDYRVEGGGGGSNPTQVKGAEKTMLHVSS